MPLKKVIADLSRGVFSPLSTKKGNSRNSLLYYQSPDTKNIPNTHIYYEPTEEFEWDATAALLDENDAAGEIIVHRLPTSPDSKSNSDDLALSESQKESPPALDTQSSETTTNENSNGTRDKEKERAYTEEEFTSAILARSHQEAEQTHSSSTIPSLSDVVEEVNEGNGEEVDMADSGVASMVRDSLVVNSCQSLNNRTDGREDCDCERRCSNPKHLADCKNSDYAVSPVLERRNKGVLGRLRNFASRTSYSTSEDGHSHSSDYEEQDEDKKVEARFYRDSRERTSSSWAGRVRDLHRDVKKKISRLRNSRGATQDEEQEEGAENSDVVIQPGSSVESIPSGSGSSLQPPTPTSSNRSSTSAGEDDHNSYVGTFIGKARALVDCTPSPYDRDGLAFKKGDIIDIIAKHKTGIWVGMAQGKVGHFKFINVEEVVEERKCKHRRRKNNIDWLNLPKKPETLEELLKQIGLEEYTNVLVLNGYDELDTFKEIEKVDLDSLGILNPEHSSKLLRAAEILQDVDLDIEDLEDESQIKQSPRDSGCYASHENLIQQDSSQRALNNGQFTVDLEDQDTSHSESGTHSREGPDSTLAMNNLDLSGESVTKSMPSTVDDVTAVTSTNEHSEEHINYNILPLQKIVNNEEGRTTNNSVVDTSLPKSEPGPLSVPYFLSTSGTKSSPGSPRKVRNKHNRHKSHSHKNKDFLSEFSYNSYTYNISRCRQISAEAYPERGGYVYAWTSFSRTDNKSSRRNLHEYDDIVSDPATEAEDSPGRHVYRRVKQRKGSLQTLIHDTRSPSPTLISKVNKKLVAEKIYLYEEPYTDKTGFCGIPPALVQRYSEELQHSIVDVADALDQIRITALQQQSRRGVPNDFLSDSCVAPVIEPNYTSLHAWLISLGLPMYMQNFFAAGITELYQIASLGIDDLTHLGIHDPYHQVFLESALGVLYMKFQRRPHTYTQGHSLS
ncbi:SAM and SH3 domain-containing protein 1 isoform X2 [Parasteatoda tepidariorum]|uniref:SAM and SH3 domain-containing protein 1 isoform X2 n=2 Tax=Parasteatoda tepidariorum TaxID=114398 RepID=UPI001C721C2C|nr:uncharacterized protein LOC107439224 isoform X2 [Parasteatoda tepidariorum]